MMPSAVIRWSLSPASIGFLEALDRVMTVDSRRHVDLSFLADKCKLRALPMRRVVNRRCRNCAPRPTSATRRPPRWISPLIRPMLRPTILHCLTSGVLTLALTFGCGGACE
jgi:hypothetical protein